MENIENSKVVFVRDAVLDDCPEIAKAVEKIYAKQYREICILYCQVNDLDVRLLYPLDEEDYINSILAGDSKFGYTEGKYPKELFEQPTIKMSSHNVKQSDLPKPKNSQPFYTKFLKRNARKK